MIAQDSIQAVQYRLAQHYLNRLKQADRGTQQGLENRAHWLNLMRQDWEQIQLWQSWSAAWQDTDLERAHLCVTFPMESAAILRVRLPASEQLNWVRQALAAAQKLHDDKAERALLYQLSYLSITLELPDQAEQYARKLVERAETSHDKLNLGRASFLLGAIAFIRSQYDRAEEAFRTSLLQLQACHAVEEIGQVWLGLGRVANVRGDFQQAHAYYLQYLQTSTVVGNEQAVLDAHISLGGIYLDLGDFLTAEAHAQRAVDMARPLGKSRFLPPALFGLAHAKKNQGKYENACDHYTEGIEVARAISSAPSSIANGLHGLGQAKYLQGDDEAALSYLEEGLQIVREARFLLRVCEIAHDMVFVHVTRNELESARIRLRETLESAQQLATPHFQAKALAAAVVLWQHSGEPEQAAVWAGLLRNYEHMLQPTLFHAVVYDQLQNILGAQRYRAALEQGKNLKLENVTSDILRLLNHSG